MRTSAKQWLAGCAVLAMVIAAACVPEPPGGGGSTTTTTVPPSAEPYSTDGAVLAMIRMGDSVFTLNVADLPGPGRGSITKLRAADGAVEATFALGGADTNAHAMVSDGDHLWVAYTRSGAAGLIKVRPSDGAILDDIGVDGTGAFYPYALGFDGTGVWAAGSTGYAAGLLRRYRASDGVLLVQTNLPAGFEPGDTTSIGFDGSSIWVAGGSSCTAQVLKVRPSDGLVQATVAVGKGKARLVMAGGHVHAVDNASLEGSCFPPHQPVTLTRLNPGTAAVLDTLEFAPPPLGESGINVIAASGSHVWVSSSVWGPGVTSPGVTRRVGLGTSSYSTANRTDFHSPFVSAATLVVGDELWIGRTFVPGGNYSSGVSVRNAWEGIAAAAVPISSGDVEVTDEGDVWALSSASGNRRLVRVDDDGTELQSIPLDFDPYQFALQRDVTWLPGGEPHDILWVTEPYGGSGGSVHAISVSHGLELTALNIGGQPFGITSDGTDVWIANGLGVYRITPSLEDSGLVPVASGPFAVTFDGTHLWTANTTANSVSKIDPVAGTVLASYPVGQQPLALVAVGGSIWVANSGSDTLTKLRASDGFPQGLIELENAGTLADIATDGSSVWVTNSVGFGGYVARIRASDGARLSTLSGFILPSGLAYDGSHLWMSSLGGLYRMTT